MTIWGYEARFLPGEHNMTYEGEEIPWRRCQWLERYHIIGNKSLEEHQLKGAKNAVLPILAATILTDPLVL